MSPNPNSIEDKLPLLSTDARRLSDPDLDGGPSLAPSAELMMAQSLLIRRLFLFFPDPVQPLCPQLLLQLSVVSTPRLLLINVLGQCLRTSLPPPAFLFLHTTRLSASYVFVSSTLRAKKDLRITEVPANGSRILNLGF